MNNTSLCCCNTQRRMRLIEGGNPRPGLRSKDLMVNILLKGTKNPTSEEYGKGVKRQPCRQYQDAVQQKEYRKLLGGTGRRWEVQHRGWESTAQGEYEGFTKHYIRSRIK